MIAVLIVKARLLLLLHLVSSLAGVRAGGDSGTLGPGNLDEVSRVFYSFTGA